MNDRKEKVQSIIEQMFGQRLSAKEYHRLILRYSLALNIRINEVLAILDNDPQPITGYIRQSVTLKKVGCGKAAYFSRMDAKQALKKYARLKESKDLKTIYQCHHCTLWHMSSMVHKNPKPFLFMIDGEKL